MTGAGASRMPATLSSTCSGDAMTRLHHNAETGEDEFVVTMEPHAGHGDSRELCRGIVGDANRVSFG